MLKHLLWYVVALSASTGFFVFFLDSALQFYQAYQAARAKIESETWLRTRCSDPIFFANMHMHSDICFSVENSYRVGACLLALREVTVSFRIQQFLMEILANAKSVTWPVIALAVVMLIACPSWLISSSRTRRWPEPSDRTLKNA